MATGRWCGFLAGLCFSAGMAGQGMRTQTAMHTRVMALYSFHPHTLSDAERASKSREMDAFWNDVKADPAAELPLLRQELRDTSDPAFFAVDGSELLLSLSHERADEELVAEALPRADLADVQPPSYFYTVHTLAMDGIDVTRAALHLLDDPAFAVPVPQHAMTLHTQDCLLYLLLPVQAEVWLPQVQAQMASKRTDEQKKALVTLLFYAQTNAADAALRAAAADSGLSEAVRKDASQYLQDEKQALRIKTSVAGNEDAVRAARRKRLGAVSDEAMGEVQEMTARLIQLRAGRR